MACSVSSILKRSGRTPSRPTTVQASSGISPKPKRRSSKDTEPQDARPYQLELLDAAIEENTIVNLGTGAGKTFIAVMLIRELSSVILRPFGDEDAKRTVFLVTTVPLVKQQAGYIRTHTCLQVGEYIGDMGVDSWLPDRWHIEFDHYRVLVMTMTIFKNLVQQSFLPLKKVNLVVFDECHHAVKNHDYVQIMKLFEPHFQAGDEVPRVLGLTASLIPSKCKPGEIKKKINELEKILCSRSQTAEDLKQVAVYATNPDEEVIVFESSDKDKHICDLKRILEGPVNFLESFKRKQKEGSVYELVKLYLDDLLHILVNLGVWCADKFAVEGLRAIEGEISECGDHFVNDWERSLIYLGRTQLKIFIQKSQEKLELARRTERYPTTNKVKRLALYLGDTAVANGDLCLDDSDPVSKKNPNKLLGIVFVERRTTAVMLTKLLRHLKEIDSDLKHIKCDSVVGHNVGRKGTHLRREAKMNVKKQFEVLDMFRREKINLLISTSVVEEGVDVPRCNNVVRFDFPQNFRAYIQSKGRARAKVSKYLLLIDSKDASKVYPDLEDYRILEKELQFICHGRVVPEEEEILKRMEEEVDPYMPFGKDGPVQTLGSSLSLVHRYCQKLPKDRYTILSPSFKTEKQENPETTYFATAAADDSEQERKPLYRSTLTLPMNSPVKDPIQGLWMPTRRIAEKSAALEAVKLLHEAKELDDYLKPFTKDDDDSDVEDEAKMAEKRIPNAGTEKRPHHYPNRVASSLSGCFPMAGPGNHLYYFLIRESDTGSMYQSQPEGWAHVTTLGILTRKILPHIKVPEFSLFDGEKELHVILLKYHNILSDISQRELDTLKLCHDVIFTEALKIRASWLHLNFQSSAKDYIVVPVNIIPQVEPREAYLDLTLAETIARMKTPSGSSYAVTELSKAWPVPIEIFNNALVTDIHMPSDRRKLYEVLKVDLETTLLSEFPDPSSASTYMEYFQTKYNYPLTDLGQPALQCKPLGLSDTRIKMLTSRFKDNTGQDLSRRVTSRDIKLFPELCSIYPIPANVWKLIRCLPSILWRLECTLSVDEFRMTVSQETGIGIPIRGSKMEVTTQTHLRGYKDYGYGNLLTQCFTTDQVGEVERLPISSPDFLQLSQRGPDNALLLQAFTPKGAMDSINLERLETLGDSFLKLVTSIFLFHDRQSAHEGRLTSARSRRVENLNLFVLAKQREKRIPDHILSTSFEPRQMWIPPCFSFDESDPDLSLAQPQQSGIKAQEGVSQEQLSPSGQARHYLYHKVTDKGVADCVESLIGAYLVSGGIDAGLKFMKWVGIKINPETKATDVQETSDSHLPSEDERESGELTSSSSSPYTPPVPKRTKVAPFHDPGFQQLQQGGAHQQSEPKLPLFVRCSSTIFNNHFPSPPKPILDLRQKNEVEKLLQKSFGTHKQLQQLFEPIRDKSLLLQALTHASYAKNRVTDCYQRLEFLGDAVLDYLVTCHIYSTFPTYGPGDISGMRAALVNNNTFAELAVKLKLHKAVLHNSPTLFSQIGNYVSTLESLEEDTEHVQFVVTDIRDADGKLPQGANSDGLATPPKQSDGSSDDEVDEVDEIEPPKVLGDILESLAGAIFVDSGLCLESVWKVFQPLFDERIASFKGKVPLLPLQELFDRKPDAQTIRTRVGVGSVRCTIMFVDSDGQSRKFSAKSKTFKSAKMAAARAALREMDRGD